MKTERKPQKIRVMLVDDHDGFREALRKTIHLKPDLEVVAEANSGRVAIELLPRVNPDVILMDGSMPDMSGIETTRLMKQVQPGVKVVGLTLYGESTYLEEMVAVGVRGYLIKTGAPDEVINAIRIVNNGGTYFDSAISQRHSKATGSATPAIEELTVGELAVAKLIAKGHTHSEIAVLLGIALRSVELRRVAAMKKLGLRSRAELVRIAAKHNWLSA